MKLGIDFGGFILLQVILLIISYGGYLNLPWWVVWLPSLVIMGVIILGLLLLVIIGIVWWIGR